MKPHWIMSCLAVVMICSACGQAQPHKVQQRENIAGLPGPVKSLAESITPDLAGGKEGKFRADHSLSLADLHRKYPGTFKLNGPASKRAVALTFDDAPDDYFTPQVLDILKTNGVKATFFVIGNRVQTHPEVFKRMVAEGHAIGNHSYSHANLPKLTDDQFHREITMTDNLIQPYTGYIPNLVRPPYGNIDETQIQWLASQHKKIVNWNVDSLDWKGLGAQQVETNVLAHVQSGSIILQHAAGGKGEDLSGTIQALPVIINQLREHGMKLVTVPELLGIPSGQ